MSNNEDVIIEMQVKASRAMIEWSKKLDDYQAKLRAEVERTKEKRVCKHCGKDYYMVAINSRCPCKSKYWKGGVGVGTRDK